ncbi:hypothetical protein EDB89DRAFT_210264 [Lactarius sanguifluus]|nr:hypothetical protein EDB89DRAFT_210264 [Lactarius sanguifluus]
MPNTLLTRPALISVANYASLAHPPITLGGLGLTPTFIGLWLSAYGCASALFQFAFFPASSSPARPHSPRSTSCSRLRTCWLVMAVRLRPLCGRSSRCNSCRVPPLTWGSMCAVFMFLSSAAPNKQSLGATNGLAQTVVSIQRAVSRCA